jgi:hypothetical protein
MANQLDNPVLAHEKVLKLLITNAQAVLSTYDEPLAIMITIAWQPQLGNDLPPGTLVTKSVGGADLATLLACLHQGAKLLNNLGSRISTLAKPEDPKNVQIQSIQAKNTNEKEATRQINPDDV